MTGLIQRIFKGIQGDKKEFKEKFKQAEMEDKVQRRLEERKLSSNERELNDYHKRQREEQIKKALEKIHDKQNKDNWKSNSILTSQKNILISDKPKSSNILKSNKNMFLGRGSMF